MAHCFRLWNHPVLGFWHYTHLLYRTPWVDWAVSQERRTSSLTRRAEHCKGTPIILCGFHVTELALKERNQVKRVAPMTGSDYKVLCGDSRASGFLALFPRLLDDTNFAKQEVASSIYTLFFVHRESRWGQSPSCGAPFASMQEFSQSTRGLKAPSRDGDQAVQGPVSGHQGAEHHAREGTVLVCLHCSCFWHYHSGSELRVVAHFTA